MPYLYSNALADYSTYSVASLSASSYTLFATGPTYLTGSASGSSTTTGTATGLEDYTSGLNGVSTSIGTATGTAVLNPSDNKSSRRRRGDLFVTTQPQMRPAPGRDLEDQAREATHLLGSATGTSKSIGMAIGSAAIRATFKNAITLQPAITTGLSDYRAAVKREIQVEHYAIGYKLESRTVRDAQDLAALLLLGL